MKNLLIKQFKVIVILLTSLFCVNSFSQEDLIYLMTGDQVDAIVLSMDDENVQYQVKDDDKILELNKNQIFMIKFTDGRTEFFGFKEGDYDNVSTNRKDIEIIINIEDFYIENPYYIKQHKKLWESEYLVIEVLVKDNNMQYPEFVYFEIDTTMNEKETKFKVHKMKKLDEVINRFDTNEYSTKKRLELGKLSFTVSVFNGKLNKPVSYALGYAFGNQQTYFFKKREFDLNLSETDSKIIINISPKIKRKYWFRRIDGTKAELTVNFRVD